MYIKKIEIENILCFYKKIELDLKQNIKNLEHDFVAGFFVKKNNNQIFSPLTAIAGRNASGKTTFIETVYRMFQFFSLNEQTILFMNDVYKEITKEKEISKYVSNLKNIDLISIYKLYLNNQIYLMLGIKDYFEIKRNKIFSYFYVDNIDVESEKYIIDKLIEGIEKKYYDMFYSLKHKKDINSSISIQFYSNQYGEISFSYFDQLNGDKFSTFFFRLDIKNKESIDLKKLINDFLNYCSNVVHLNFWTDSLFIKNNNLLNLAFTKLLSTYKKEDVINIINIADKSICDFVCVKNDQYRKELLELKYLINDNKHTIFPESLSAGTKKFIIMFANIVDSMKKSKSTLILIDEIENCFHNEIVNFIKKFILNASAYRDTQLFFTSHSPQALSSYISSKQVYYIDTEEQTKFVRVSTNINKNNSLLKQILEKRIGEHPSESLINQQSIDLYIDGFEND